MAAPSTEAPVAAAGAEQRSTSVSPTRWLAAAGVALVVLVYAISALHFADMPLRIEENEWPPMAQAIVDSGKPVIAADETHRVRFTPDLQVDSYPLIGAWHPPLYQYTLAVATLVAGDDAANGLRAVGVIGLLASALLLLLIAREVTPRWRLIGGVAAGLLLIHPFAIQGSVFLDIDNTVYGPLALLAMWLAIRLSRHPGALGATQVLALGGALALVTWAKMTTTIALVGVLVVWWLLSRRPLRRAAAEAVGFVAAGAVLFTVTYALWCSATGIAFSYTFDVTFAQKSDRLFANSLLMDQAAHWHLRWLGAAMLVLALAYLVDLVRAFVATRRLRELDLLFLFGAGVVFNYVVVSPTDGTYQGKYAFPALAAMLLPIVWMLLRKPLERASAARWIAAVAIGAVAALLVPDRLANLSVNGAYGVWTTELAVVAGCALALALAWSLGGRRGFAGGVLIVFALLLVGQGIRSYRADSSPMYPVSDTDDFRAAVADLNARAGPDEVVVAPKDLGFYVEGPVVEGEDAFARGDDLLAAVIQRYPRIVAVARDSFGPPLGPATLALMDRCFRERKALGSITLAYRSGDCSP